MSDAKNTQASFYLNLPTTYEEWIEMGELSFGKFYSYGGIKMLHNFLKVCERKPNLIKKVRIRDDQGAEYTADDFITYLGDIEVIDNG
tara:strand:+ start:487 stop:750 length:264 start_codon:yes stop_codon:yes gene_type:complete